MASIQVKNIPEGLHNKLRRHAREQEITISEIVLEAIEREVARREWHKRFTSRPTTRLRSTAAELLEQERRLRDSDLSWAFSSSMLRRQPNTCSERR
jgi:plasmid stability protein